MAKMFGLMEAYRDGKPFGGKATRLGDEMIVATLTNTQRGGGGGKTTVEVKLHEDGSGTISIRREGETGLGFRWSEDDASAGLTYGVKVAQ